MKMTIEQFEALPKEVQEKVKGALTAYESIAITYENGEYRFGTMLKKHYAADYKVIGRIEKATIFSEKEQTLNYINTFHSYPSNFKGKRDYSIFKDAVMNVTTYKYDENGEIVKA